MPWHAQIFLLRIDEEKKKKIFLWLSHIMGTIHLKIYDFSLPMREKTIFLYVLDFADIKYSWWTVDIKEKDTGKVVINIWVEWRIFLFIHTTCDEKLQKFPFQSRKHAHLHVDITNSYVCFSIHPLSKEHKKWIKNFLFIE